MRKALLCFGLFACAFLVQMLWWRMCVPVFQRQALLGIFLGVLGLFLVAAAFGAASLRECAHVLVFYVPLMLAYIAFFTAIEADSPSMTIATSVARAGDAGLCAEELTQLFAANSPLAHRLEAMVVEGMLTRQGEMLRLTPKGRWMAQLFTWTAKLMGFEPGG